MLKYFAYPVERGRQGKLLVEPHYCSKLVLAGQGQHAARGSSPALAPLPSYCYSFVSCWPWLESVDVYAEHKLGGIDAVAELLYE